MSIVHKEANSEVEVQHFIFHMPMISRNGGLYVPLGVYERR